MHDIFLIIDRKSVRIPSQISVIICNLLLQVFILLTLPLRNLLENTGINIWIMRLRVKITFNFFANYLIVIFDPFEVICEITLKLDCLIFKLFEPEVGLAQDYTEKLL
jgi:hypothetical protein